MKNPKIHIGNVMKSWIQEHAEINHETDKMVKAILNLRLEGKNLAENNLKQIQGVLEYFDKTLICHIAAEEKGLFPFLDRHVPKLETLTRLLRSEHLSIMEEIKGIETLVKKIRKQRWCVESVRDVELLRESGTYLVHILRGHAHEENSSVYRAVTHELRHSEQKELIRVMEQCRLDYLEK